MGGSFQRHSYQDILLLIARNRASPNVLKSKLPLPDRSMFPSLGALECALSGLNAGHPEATDIVSY
ncbi:hypothetical protein C4E44_02275 [Pseudomonas sp. MWU12-2312b]|nr:hypothetical protein C4E44_02275 [Pseudomonas sp. MWU12-2312b]